MVADDETLSATYPAAFEYIAADSDDDYTTEYGLTLSAPSDLADFWAADQFIGAESVYFYSWQPLTGTDDEPSFFAGETVNVWVWGDVETATANETQEVVLEGASTLGLAFASALFAANMF